MCNTLQKHTGDTILGRFHSLADAVVEVVRDGEEASMNVQANATIYTPTERPAWPCDLVRRRRAGGHARRRARRVRPR